VAPCCVAIAASNMMRSHGLHCADAVVEHRVCSPHLVDASSRSLAYGGSSADIGPSGDLSLVSKIC
jgi:hypothetical protein